MPNVTMSYGVGWEGSVGVDSRLPPTAGRYHYQKGKQLHFTDILYINFNKYHIECIVNKVSKL